MTSQAPATSQEIGDRLQEAKDRELSLRKERAEIPERISAASREVQNLRGDGRRDGDPDLDEKLREVRELSGRYDVLPDLICDAVAQRCSIQVEILLERERTLSEEAEALQSEAQKVQRALERARRKATEAQSRVEGIEMQRESIRRTAGGLETFVRQADELSGAKRIRLLSEAAANGLLLPLREVQEFSESR